MTTAEIQAMPAGKALDKLVAEKVMGQVWQGSNPIPSYDGRWPWPPPYSTDITVAWLAIDAWKGDAELRRQNGQWRCWLFRPSSEWQAWGETGSGTV